MVLRMLEMRTASLAAFSLAMLLAGPTGALAAPPTEGPARFLTGPRSGDPVEIGLGYVRERAASLGLEPQDLDEHVLSDRIRSRHNGLTHVRLRQRLGGIEVYKGDLQYAVMDDGRMIGLHSRFVRRLGQRANRRVPGLSASEALDRAALHLGLVVSQSVAVLGGPSGPARATVLGDGGVSQDPIPARLVYVPLEAGEVRLAWNLVIHPLDGLHWWEMNIDAVDGSVLSQADWVDSASYNVFAFALENPFDGPRTIEVDPHDPAASPFGWHDTNGVAGAESFFTIGNNVSAQDDTNGNNVGGTRPNGGTGLDFNSTLDLTQTPASYLDAAITNLFYMNNLLHDLHYAYGFDEASGNFQTNNYGNGGTAGDPVQADAQDGAGINNANMSTPTDGIDPRMQMFLWQFPGLTISAPPSVAGSIQGGTASFGPAIGSPDVAEELVLALDPADGAGPSTTDACSPLTNGAAIAGKIALVDRGDCDFILKTFHVQQEGGLGIVIANNQGDDLTNMSGSGFTITIPAVFIAQSHGDQLKAALAGTTVSAELSEVNLDGDLDNGIIIHEYGHGVSTRLTGGRFNSSCLILTQADGMSEGWSDFWAVALTSRPSDTRLDARPMAAYLSGALGGPRNGPGIRNFRYSTDPGVNPLSFIDIELLNQPHGVGEVWALMLWEMYWNLVDAHGYDPDLFTGTGGNNLALQLVMDGLRLQPCDPTFAEGRDAILQADVANSGGANQCLIWQAFAKRGLGVSASSGANFALPFPPDVTEAFDEPISCTCGDDIIDPGEDCDGTALGSCTAGCAINCSCTPDADADGWEDGADNCPYAANPLQADEDLDGVGDACECGDVSDEGLFSIADIDEFRDVLAQRIPLLTAPQKCNVRGPMDLGDDDADGRPNDCDLVDLVVAIRELSLFDPRLQQVCAPALP